jgi:hypothetical protein
VELGDPAGKTQEVGNGTQLIDLSGEDGVRFSASENSNFLPATQHRPSPFCALK